MERTKITSVTVSTCITLSSTWCKADFESEKEWFEWIEKVWKDGGEAWQQVEEAVHDDPIENFMNGDEIMEITLHDEKSNISQELGEDEEWDAVYPQ